MPRIRKIRQSRKGPPPPTAREREVEREQRKLDDALRDSFPASDPVAFLEPSPSKEDDVKSRRS